MTRFFFSFLAFAPLGLNIDVFVSLCRSRSHSLLALLLLDAGLGLLFGELAEVGFSILLLDTDSLGLLSGLNGQPSIQVLWWVPYLLASYPFYHLFWFEALDWTVFKRKRDRRASDDADLLEVGWTSKHDDQISRRMAENLAIGNNTQTSQLHVCPHSLQCKKRSPSLSEPPSQAANVS